MRLSHDDCERQKQLADGLALATYIRAKALGEAMTRQKSRSGASVGDKQELAQILELLGQSRIANNLNQLAHHANIGSLAVNEDRRPKSPKPMSMCSICAKPRSQLWDCGNDPEGNQRANGRELLTCAPKTSPE